MDSRSAGFSSQYSPRKNIRRRFGNRKRALGHSSDYGFDLSPCYEIKSAKAKSSGVQRWSGSVLVKGLFAYCDNGYVRTSLCCYAVRKHYQHSKPLTSNRLLRKENTESITVCYYTQTFIRLFDSGYVTITPDYKFRASRSLKDDFDNGEDYFGYNGTGIWLPPDSDSRPNRQFLRMAFRYCLSRITDFCIDALETMFSRRVYRVCIANSASELLMN